MIDAPFGSISPMWAAAPTPGHMLQTPVQTPIGFGNAAIGATGFGSSALLGGPGASLTVGRDAPIFSATPAYTYLPANAITAAGLPAPFPFGGSAQPNFGNSEPVMGVNAPALLTAVAMQRGQPQGPANDQEVEDFIYDALELLSGTADVDIRCEGGRATLTGNVHHKRAKRDAGEIAWAIPGVNDVQNNITIASRRRARASRETETPGAQTRK
jgi:hypothetical protein